MSRIDWQKLNFMYLIYHAYIRCPCHWSLRNNLSHWQVPPQVHLAQLFGQGSLKLSTRVSKYLPGISYIALADMV